MKGSLLVTALALLAGCRQHFPLPFTSADLASYNTGAALTHYLAQPDASPAVCDPRVNGPHLSKVDDDDATDIVDGLVSGRIAPALWKRCAQGLVKGLPPRDASRFLDAQGRAYRALLRDSDLDAAARKQEALST